MKKNSIIYALTAVIGTSGTVCCTNQLPTNPDAIVLSEAAVPIETIESTDTAPVTSQTQAITPILVPFNQNLYTLCCEKKISQYKWNFFLTLASVAALSVSAVTITVPSILSYTPVTTVASNFIKEFINQKWYWKIWTSLKTPVVTTFVFGQIFLSTSHMIACAKSLAYGNDFNKMILWEDRELEPFLVKQEIWHKEIRACFGNPIIEGTVPAVGKYQIIGEKKSGAGKVIFDPFDLNQVKILLGIHDRITENLQCTKITIVPLA